MLDDLDVVWSVDIFSVFVAGAVDGYVGLRDIC